MKTDTGPEPLVRVPPQPRRLYRDPSNRIVAGVAAGIAEHLGVRAVYVRVGFIVLVAVYAPCALMYAAFWAVLPTKPTTAPRRKVPFLQRAALLALTIGLVTVRGLIGGYTDDISLIALLALVAFGAGTIWHRPTPAVAVARPSPFLRRPYPPQFRRRPFRCRPFRRMFLWRPFLRQPRRRPRLWYRPMTWWPVRRSRPGRAPRTPARSRWRAWAIGAGCRYG
jgi:phage shock protein PspC (stress-responsive transcriptional regulator)